MFFRFRKGKPLASPTPDDAVTEDRNRSEAAPGTDWVPAERPAAQEPGTTLADRDTDTRGNRSRGRAIESARGSHK
jgi:hypothetical protein